MIIEKYQIIIITIFILISLGGILWYIITSKIKKFIIKKRFKRGKTGEIRTANYLKKKGYKILIEQPELKSKISINKKECIYKIRGDFIAEKKGKLYLIEVKTGNEAIDPLYSNTRRQLFEYFHLFDFDKLLLVNANNFEITEIRFPDQKNYKSKKIIFNFLTGLLAGILLSIIFYYIKYF